MNDNPKTNVEKFDWVTARSECSLANVYEKLKLDIQADMETRNALRPELAHYAFKFSSGSRSFTVLIISNKVHESVTFHLAEKCIEVQTQDAPMFEATVGLNADGECVLRIKGQDYRPWQVAKLALEHLFFEVI
jgi:hypothetical protein